MWFCVRVRTGQYFWVCSCACTVLLFLCLACHIILRFCFHCHNDCQVSFLCGFPLFSFSSCSHLRFLLSFSFSPLTAPMLLQFALHFGSLLRLSVASLLLILSLPFSTFLD